MSQQEIPQILLGGLSHRSNTLESEMSPDFLPTINDKEGAHLDELLREHKTEATKNQGFWSLRLLRHILSRERVLEELTKYSDLDSKTYVDYIRPEEDPLPDSGTLTYLKIFALLVLFDRGEDIVAFVDERVSDQSLPLSHRPGTKESHIDLGSKDAPERRLACLQKWKTHERDALEKQQWEFLTPFFELDDRLRAIHYSLNDRTILPWCKRAKNSRMSTLPSKNDGGFASVASVKLDPLSHGFHAVLKQLSLNDGLFALKILHEMDGSNDIIFQNDCEQLRRFNGLVHDHLVTLLATITFQGQYHFLFPYADYSLDQYWESRVPVPHMNLETIRWVAKQCAGIMAAMDTIHDPRHLNLHLKEKGYGRHGDIKPDNILWFNSTTDPKGILVVSDLGLASFNRETSRSNIPNAGIPPVPGYRPPECDIKGGRISRAYDIWTLGCLFLELMTWLLGGWKLKQEFNEKRTTTFIITGAKNNIFFCIKKTSEPGVYVAQLKPEVTAWLDKLHSHKNCSQFVHDVLNVIEQGMLVVLSEDRKRFLSGNLREKFEGFYSRCMDSHDQDYCTKGIPVPLPKVSRHATAVEAILNENAEKLMGNHPPDLEIEPYVGKIRKSMWPQASAIPTGIALNPPEENNSQLAGLPEKAATRTLADSGGSVTHQTMSGFAHQTSASPTSLGSGNTNKMVATQPDASVTRSIDDATIPDEEEQSLSVASGELEDDHDKWYDPRDTHLTHEDSSNREILPEKCEERLNNPTGYFRKLELLEESIYLHSALFFHASSSSESQFQMPFPEFEILEDTEPQMFDMLRNASEERHVQQNGVQLHLFHVRNIVFSVYINLVRLKLERYCEDFISLLVMDQSRPDHVAKLIRLPLLEVKRLAQAFNYASSKKVHHRTEQFNLNEECYHILTLLGVPSIFQVSGTSNLDNLSQSEDPLATAIHMWYSVAHTLDLAVLSYSGAHIENFDETYLGARKESFEIPSQFLVVDGFENIPNWETIFLPTVCLRRRSLQCLDNFLHRDVWVFHTLPDSQSHDKLYLQTDIETFADIWGPLWASSLKSKPDKIYEFNVGNGTILAWPMDPDQKEYAILSPDEVFCHWVSWREPWINNKLLQRKLVKRHLHLGDKLLIGASSNSLLELTRNDHCQRSLVNIKQGLADIRALNHLRTARRDRVKDSQTVAVTAGGLGVTAGTSTTYKRRDGQTWKNALVEDWRDVQPDGTRNVNIVLLEYYVGLEVSLCTMNGRRVRLLDVLSTKTMKLYLNGRDFKWGEWGKSLEEEYFKALRSPESFRSLWKIRKYRKTIGDAISRCIDALAETGVDELTGALNALWVVEAETPDSDIGDASVDGPSPEDHSPSDESQSGSGSECSDDELTFTEEYTMSLFRSEHTWTRFLKDTRDILTMAVVEDNCLEFNHEHGRLCTSKRLAEDGKLVRWVTNGYPVLQTGLEINKLLLEKEGVVKVDLEGTRPYWDVRNIKKTTRFRLGEQGVLDVFDNPNSSHSSRKAKTKMTTKSTDETQPLVVEWHGVKSESLREITDVDIQQTFYGLNPEEHHREYSSTALPTRPIPIFILSKSKKMGRLE